MAKKPYPVMIVWLDAHGMYQNWEDLNDLPDDHEEGYTVVTVGHLLPGRKKGHHVVALNLSDSHVSDGIAIPKDMVVDLRKLKPVSRKRKPR